VSDIGTAMHGVGAGWLMTELAPSPAIVALVQAATTLPMFLLLLPAGALGDILDRRRLLIFALWWSLLAALALGFVTLAGWITPALLLAFTLALGVGAALAVPSFQAVVPELVPRELLPSAVALSSMGVNIARAAGPALAGLVIASTGVAAVFIFNAASTIFTIFVLWRWKREPRSSALPPEPFISALRIGARYARHNPQLGALLIRSAAFYSFAAALWALLPLVGAQLRPQDATGYAILLSCIGAGAVIGALTLPRIRPLISSDLLSAISTVAFAAATAAAGLADNFPAVAAFMLAAGWAWLANLTTFNITARFSIADWVMSRGLAINQMVFFGSLTLGSIVWGQLASLTSIGTALVSAAVGMAAVLAIAWRLPLATPAKGDLAPSLHWAEPVVSIPDPERRGPVLTTIEYQVDPAQAGAFLAALRSLETARRRNGGYGWAVFEDMETPGRYVESFLTASWIEHLRQHQRTTLADKTIQDAVRSFHRGEVPPRVSHLLSPAPPG
jgi:MFS family permease